MRNRLLLIILIIFWAGTAVIGSENESPSGQESIFNGTLADSIWTIVAFAALLIALSKTAWKPLLKNLKAREEYITNQLSSADEARLRAEKLLDEYKQQGLEIIEKTTHHADLTEKEIIEKAGKEAMAMKQRAVSEIDYATNAALQQLWQQAGDMLLLVSHEVLGRSITTDDNKRLINEAISKLQQEQSRAQK
jgi:F-type H+-transporting ATPase subunit b